jgi:hypothetical protein
MGRDGYPYWKRYSYNKLKEYLMGDPVAQKIKDFRAFVVRELRRKRMSGYLTPNNGFGMQRLPCICKWLDDNYNLICQMQLMEAFVRECQSEQSAH